MGEAAWAASLIACCPAPDRRPPATKALHTICSNKTSIESSSWWWAYKCLKHVEQITSAIKHSVPSSWFSSQHLNNDARTNKHLIYYLFLIRNLVWNVERNKCRTLVGKFEEKKTRYKWGDGQENNIKKGTEETVTEIVWNLNIFRRRTGWTICCLNSRQRMRFSLHVNYPDQPWDPPSSLLNTYGVLSLEQRGQVVKLSSTFTSCCG